MRHLLLISIILVFLTNGCKDPASVEADREKKVIYDPNNLPPQFEIIPKVIDMQTIEHGNSGESRFTIKNITDKQVKIKSLKFKNNQDNSSFPKTLFPIYLNPKGMMGDSLTVEFSLTPKYVGYFKDTIIFEDHKNPVAEVNAAIPAVFCTDLDFDEIQVGLFDLKIVNIVNLSPSEVTITEFEVYDVDNVFYNEPKFKVPSTIKPNSQSTDIRITFNPIHAKQYQAEIRFKAEFKSGNYPYKGVIIIKGKGIN